MFGTRFFGLGHNRCGQNPAFFQRLRSWFRQTFVLDFGVSEIIGPVPVVAKEQEAKILNTPAPFSRSAKRAPPLATPYAPAGATATTTATTQPTKWRDMKTITNIRRLRRREGWYNSRRENQMRMKEERTGLLAAVELS